MASGVMTVVRSLMTIDHELKCYVGYTSGSDTVCGLCTVRNFINNEHGKVHPWCGNNKGEFHLLVKIF